jgi:hypothetical protein
VILYEFLKYFLDAYIVTSRHARLNGKTSQLTLL